MSDNPVDTATSSDQAPTESPPPKRRWKKRYVLLALLLLLVAGEVSVRIYAALDSNFNIRIGALKQADKDLIVRLRSDYSVGGVRTNSKGILGPEFDARKPAGSYRIVTLGDSCSFIPVEHNYPTVLQELLRKELPDCRIDVINASCPGYHSGQARRWYEREIDGYEHDLLIVYVGWNDIGYYNPETTGWATSDLNQAHQSTFLERLAQNCYLLRLPAALATYRTQGGPVTRQPLTTLEARTYFLDWHPTPYEENLTAIIHLARSRGREVFLLNRATLANHSPTEDEQRRMHFPVGLDRNLTKFLALIEIYDKAMRTVAQREDVPVIDIRSLFQTTEERKVFTDSSHFNATGAERIAERVAERILPTVKRACAELHD